MSDIFISYSTADRARVKPIVEALSKHGWSVWWDREILPGKDWQKVIQAALEEARCVIVLWSKHSVDADWVQIEAAEGKRRHLLVPALLDDVPIPLEFTRIQAASLVGWSGELPDTRFDTLARGVADVLERGSPPAATAPAVAEISKTAVSGVRPMFRRPTFLLAAAIALIGGGLSWYYAAHRRAATDQAVLFVPSAALTPDLRKSLEHTLTGFYEHLKDVGFAAAGQKPSEPRAFCSESRW